MALTIHEHKETNMAVRIASEKIWLTVDKDKVVPDGDPEARFLLAGPGDEIPPEYDDVKIPAKYLGKPDDDDDTKAAAAPANKAAAKAANK